MTTIAVAMKWVDLRPEVDRLTGSVHHDRRFFGCSAADQAALEHALTLADAWGWSVAALCAGPPPADALLREALAAGASSVARIGTDAGDAPEDDAASEAVAAALADAVRPLDDVRLVCCGDWSLDRGSGSVPAFLAAHLGWGQALGLVDLTPSIVPGQLNVTRRLDHGRREVLRIEGPAVMSVEGGTAELRRSSLAAVLRANAAAIPVIERPPATRLRVKVVHRGPDRPRARALPPPDPALSARERILSLTGALVDRTPPRTVRCGPDAAADLILDQLRTWGYPIPRPAPPGYPVPRRAPPSPAALPDQPD